MKKNCICIIGMLLSSIAYSQNIRPAISLSDNSNINNVLSFSYNEGDYNSIIPYIDININITVYAVSLFNNDKKQEVILLNKDDKYCTKDSYSSSVLSSITEEIILNSQYEYISFYDISMNESTYGINKIRKTINALAETLELLNSKNIVVGKNRNELLERCKETFSIKVIKNDIDDIPKMFDENNNEIKFCLTNYNEIVNIDLEFFERIDYGVYDIIRMIVEYNENVIDLEYYAVQIKDILNGNEREVTLKPINAKYYYNNKTEK